MPLDATAAEFRAAALDLREANRTMYLTARRQIRAIATPAVAAVRQSALSTLPKRGGLNQWVADAVIKTSILTGPRSAGVSIRARKTGHDLPKINAGTARHPLYGNTSYWYETPVQPGFFTRPLDEMAPVAEALFLRAMTETAYVAGFR